MKVTIEIPDELLLETMRHTGAKTKRDAILAALKWFNRRKSLEELSERLRGSCPNFMTQEDLKTMREDVKWAKS